MARFTVRISTTPDGHWQALREAAHGVAYALRKLGHDVGGTCEDSRLIAFGAHAAPSVPMPPDAIVYNSEQVPIDLDAAPPGVPATHHRVWRDWWLRYLELLQKHVVWDYSETNLQRLKSYGVERGVLCPVGYYPELTRFQPLEPNTDVLFIGSLNERRRAALKEIKARGLDVKIAYDVYGDERDALLARARLVLNVHYYPNPIWEVFRCSYLLANGLCVVSEADGRDSTLETLAAATTAYASYDALAATCLSLIVNTPRRQQIATRGAEVFKSLDQVEFVRKALEATCSVKAPV